MPVIDGMPPITFSYTEVTPEALSKLTVVKLKELADNMGVEYTSSDTKQDLIDKLTGGG